MQVAFEDPRTALHVVPERFPAVGIRGVRPDEAGNDPGADLASMDIRVMQPLRVVVGRDMGGRLQPDQGAKAVGMQGGKVEDQATADRAAHDHRSLQRQGIGEGDDERGVEIPGQKIFIALETVRRRRLAVPGHIERNDAKVLRHLGVVQDTAILPAVGTGGVQADQRDPLARFLEIDAVAPAFEIEREIATDDWLEGGGHCAAPLDVASARGASRTPFR